MAAALPIFAGLSLAGTAVSSYGQIQQGNALKSVGEQNAQIAELNAAQSDAATADQLYQLEKRTSFTLGRQKAGFAKAGVKREGTALDVLADTVNMADRDAYRISEQGRLARQGYMFQAAQERYRGTVAQQSSRIGAATTLLTGFGMTGLHYGLGRSGSLPLSTVSSGLTTTAR